MSEQVEGTTAGKLLIDLREYAAHAPICRNAAGKTCDCGLSEILDDIDSTLSAAPDEEKLRQIAEQQTGVSLIAVERDRQQAVEGWTADHDEGHTTGDLANAAACYALTGRHRKDGTVTKIWPFEDADWKPTPHNRIRELTKAGALIAAEIDRLLREEST